MPAINPQRWCTAALFWLLAAGPASSADDGDALSGRWSGSIGAAQELAIAITLAVSDGTLSAAIDIPSQNISSWQLHVERNDANGIVLVMPGIPGEPTLDGVVNGDRIAGTFRQHGQTQPFALTRGATLPALSRPQTPQPPFPYREQELTFQNGEIVLAGTLTVPDGAGPFPAALLITGSGAQDRDETILGHKPFAVIADALARRGIATLRVDDRGVGGSGGTLSDADYTMLQSDVLAGHAALREQPVIDADSVGLIGHSEGGLLAPMAAVADPRVAFTVLLAAPAVDGLTVLLEQNRLIIEADNADAAQIDAQLLYLRELAALLEREDWDAAKQHVAARVREALADSGADDATLDAMIRAKQRQTAQRIFRAFITHDPEPTLRQLQTPTLALFGALDIQVPATQNAEPMRRALTAAGNPDATVEVLEGINHLMQPAKTGDIKEYREIDTTIAPHVLTLIGDWLNARF